MSSRKYLFDLTSEKRDLDVFLSSITDTIEPDQFIGNTIPTSDPEPFITPESYQNDQSTEITLIDENRNHLDIEASVEQTAETISADNLSPNDTFADNFAESTISIEGLKENEPETISDVDTPKKENSEIGKEFVIPTYQPPTTNEEIPLTPASFLRQELPAIETNENKINQSSIRQNKKYPQKNKLGWLMVFVLFIIIAVAAGNYLWTNPEIDYRAVRWIALHVPYADKYLDIEKYQNNAATNQIKFINLRQRLITNSTLGRNIRIIEGMAKNHTQFPVSNIKIKGELYDDKGTILDAAFSTCGSLISDFSLEKSGEKELQTTISAAQWNEFSNTKIPPNGTIPFILVFTNEPSGVVKSTVTAVSFNKTQ